MEVHISKVDQERYLDLADKLRKEANKIEELASDRTFPIDIENIITWDKLDTTLQRN
jgi:hypothetical protein